MNRERRREIAAAQGLIGQARDLLNEAHEALTGTAEEEREAFDNMPPGLQESENGQRSDAAASHLEAATETLDDVLSMLDEIDASLTEAAD